MATTHDCPVCLRPGHGRSGPHFEHEQRCGHCGITWEWAERREWMQMYLAAKAAKLWAAGSAISHFLPLLKKLRAALK